MTDYAKLESELRRAQSSKNIARLTHAAADALAQAVRERDELAARAERAAELARQHGDDLIKAEAELARLRLLRAGQKAHEKALQQELTEYGVPEDWTEYQELRAKLIAQGNNCLDEKPSAQNRLQYFFKNRRPQDQGADMTDALIKELRELQMELIGRYPALSPQHAHALEQTIQLLSAPGDAEREELARKVNLVLTTDDYLLDEPSLQMLLAFLRRPAAPVTDAMVKKVVIEYLSHRGERPDRILRGGQALWETHMPAMRAALSQPAGGGK